MHCSRRSVLYYSIISSASASTEVGISRAEQLGSLEADHQLVLARCLHRHVGHAPAAKARRRALTRRPWHRHKRRAHQSSSLTAGLPLTSFQWGEMNSQLTLRRLRTVAMMATIAAGLLVGCNASSLADQPADALDRAIPAAMKRASVPGAIVGIWQDGREPYVRAFGVRDTATRQRRCPGRC